jgi:hypothetical protein
MAVRATQTDMMKFLQIIVFCALVVPFHELDRSLPMAPAVIVAFVCTALIFAPFLHLELWLLARRERRLVVPPGQQGLQESGTGHSLPSSSRPTRAASGIVLDGSYKRIALGTRRD